MAQPYKLQAPLHANYFTSQQDALTHPAEIDSHFASQRGDVHPGPLPLIVVT